MQQCMVRLLALTAAMKGMALLHEVPRLEAVHAQAIGFDGGDHPVMGKCLELVA